jgi:hexosaminidase
MRMVKAGMLAYALAVLAASAPARAYETLRLPIPSPSMHKAPNGTVILPDAYRNKESRFPVLYLLHGWSGNDTDWSSKTKIGELADTHGLIVVMPDGGYDKWYVDSPVRLDDRYETYVGEEVVAFVDGRFRTIAEKNARAITGLSMGGFGALHIALGHTGTFGAAGSISGGVDPRPFAGNWNLAGAFGDPVTNAAYWDRLAIVNNARRFEDAGIALAIDCGTDDFFAPVNRALHQRLLELKIPHDYTERPGGHGWDYWANAIRYQALYFADKFKATPVAAGIAPASLVPQPQSLTLAPAQAPFALDHHVQLLAPAALAQPARQLADALGLPLRAPGLKGTGRRIVFLRANMPAGAYRLQVRKPAITISAGDAAGAFNATQTLLQMLPRGDAARRTSARPALAVPALDIADAPRFAWRGLTLDVARHFFGVSTIKRVIDNMAAYKLNVLHLHLTDDSGWRFPVPGYPKLTTAGARGDMSDPDGPPRFYSAGDIQAIVRYAAERQIEVIPEIEMPGHAGAAARAYPEFFDGGHTFNPAHPGAWRFIDEVLAEVTRLFPSRTIHFGGDEVEAADTGWNKMPGVVAMARALSPSSAQPDFKAVEGEFARRVAQLIRKHGRTPMGWDEIVSAGVRGGTLVQWWRMDKPEVLRAALDSKQSVVLSPADHTYLDYQQGLGEPGAAWGGNVGGPMSTEKIVAWEPLPAGLDAQQKGRILGVEAALWTELVRSEAYFEFMLYPRLAAVAEVAWRTKPKATPAAFAERLSPHVARWRAYGLNVRGGPDDASRYMTH